MASKSWDVSVIRSILTNDPVGPSPTYYDSVNMAGVVRPARAGSKRPTLFHGRRIQLTPFNWWKTEDEFQRALAKALVCAASNGSNRLRRVEGHHIPYFIHSSLPETVHALIMHPEEARLHEKSVLETWGHIPNYESLHRFTLKHLPKRSVLAVSLPERVGILALDPQTPSCMDFMLDPKYIIGCCRTGHLASEET